MTYDPIKTKAYKNAFYHMYVCPTSAHRGFRYEYRRYKDNTFTLKTTLFGWQSMISRFDLTLSNINMSKNSTFVWFFFLKSLYYQWLFVSLQRQSSPSLLTMLKSCEAFFCLYTFEHGKSYTPLQNGLNLQKISLICLIHEVYRFLIETKPYSTLTILVITDCLGRWFIAKYQFSRLETR